MDNKEYSDFDRRIHSLENTYAKFSEVLVHSAVTDQKIQSMDRSLSVMQEEVKSLRRAIVTFAMSISLSAIVFAFAVFELLGQK